ncbi:voltage-dependent anion channel [Collybia nuda]|uniref:Voltage-dependent anion channel n=1 Tax=Collybia nuda TaxID=64659 RepID=A0A9P5Y2U3_9AGAR|nr:voltage-dependent anion channel [Collybia nuda]
MVCCYDGILFSSFPYGHDTELVKILCLAFFFLNLFFFVFFTAITIARYWFYPHIWSLMIRHPVSSLYTGCFPMGATTIINVAVDVINTRCHFGGKGFLYLIWAIWWLDVFISALCCWVLVHFMKTSQQHSLQAMTSVWLLPVVTLTVAASSGGVLARALQKYSPLHALVSTTVAVFLVAVGLTLALMILTIYLLRLIVHGLPPGATILSVFLPLGPTAQSGYAVLLIGQNFKSLLPLEHGNSDILRSSSAGDTINVICVCTAFFLWSLASMWIIYALLAVYEVTRQTKIPFKLPFWGLVFPNGVYANLTIALSTTFDSTFFRVFGVIYAIATMFLWLFVTTRTLWMDHFTPVWYTINMGTGVISSLAANFHFGAGSLTLEIISLVFFLLNLALFVVISAMTIARYWMFPEMWSKMISHPAQSLFVGAFAMGAATLINSALIANQLWSFGGTGFLYALWAFWMTTHHHSLSKMASLWILPMVTLIVASSTGGLIGDALSSHSVHLAIVTTAISFTALIIGLSMALMIITVYLTRLVLHGPPNAGLVLSSFIKERISFALSYWGIIFPNGVFALLSVQLGEVLESPFFHYFGAIWSLTTLILWVFVTVKTIPAIWDTSIFVAPCLANSTSSSEKMAEMTAPAVPNLPTSV